MIVEDGSGKNNADSYCSEADADAYFAARSNYDWLAADKAASLVRATAFLDNRYGEQWDGTRTKKRAQALDWPRTGVVDDEDQPIANNEIPKELKQATAEVALFISQGKLDLVQERDGKLLQDQIGPLGPTRYSETRDVGPGVYFDEYIDRLLSGLLSGIGATTSTSFLMRA